MTFLFVATGGGTIAIQGRDAWSWVPAWLRRWLPFLPPPGPGTVPASISMLEVTR